MLKLKKPINLISNNETFKFLGEFYAKVQQLYRTTIK